MAEGDERLEEKSEQATTQRREEFRKAGQVAQSREIASVLILMGIATAFYFLAQEFLRQVQGLFSVAFTDQLLRAAREGDILSALSLGGQKMFFLILPIFAITFFTGIGATVAQVGFLTAWDHISPDLQRLNPMAGFSKIFNSRSLVEGGKSIFKIIIVGCVAYVILKKEIIFTPQLAGFTINQILSYIGLVLFKLIGGVCAFTAILAIFDYGFQRWDLEKRMKMTKQEVKEEFKQREGDPLIKSRIKRIQRELAQKRMMDAVPKADVVITNPTHLAVALKYDRVNMVAPVMVAKGADLVAEKIKEIARKHNIPVVENKPLARTLFKTLKINQPIPRTLYNAVAEVLAYVYRLKGKIQQVSQQMAQENPNNLGGA